ncbi:MAG: hypothetical protein D6790_21900 [Caldilineae bacterium]|nr:MAG: hypothetical protein D6790_21900 [Caldilineae bacterium]
MIHELVNIILNALAAVGLAIAMLLTIAMYLPSLIAVAMILQGLGEIISDTLSDARAKRNKKNTTTERPKPNQPKPDHLYR